MGITSVKFVSWIITMTRHNIWDRRHYRDRMSEEKHPVSQTIYICWCQCPVGCICNYKINWGPFKNYVNKRSNLGLSICYKKYSKLLGYLACIWRLNLADSQFWILLACKQIRYRLYGAKLFQVMGSFGSIGSNFHNISPLYKINK